jgi:hypothetical protein
MKEEVRQGLRLAGGSILNINKLTDAIREGAPLIETRYPDAKSDVIAMCQEMRKTLTAIATASSIMTYFESTIASSTSQVTPPDFGDRLAHHKEDAVGISKQLRALRGSCSIIEKHAKELSRKANSAKLGNLFRLFGVDSVNRQLELTEALERIYDEEMQYHSNVVNLGGTLRHALEDVERELSSAGTFTTESSSRAVALLGEYAVAFAEIENSANYGALKLQKAIDSLGQ